MTHDEFTKKTLELANKLNITTELVVNKHTTNTIEVCANLWGSIIVNDEQKIKHWVGSVAASLISGYFVQSVNEGHDGLEGLILTESKSSLNNWEHRISKILSRTISGYYDGAYKELQLLCSGLNFDFMECCEIALTHYEDKLSEK